MAKQAVAILAGNHAQYLEWQRHNPSIRGVYCDQLPMFAGIEFSKMIRIGTFEYRPDALEIYQYVVPMVRPYDT